MLANLDLTRMWRGQRLSTSPSRQSRDTSRARGREADAPDAPLGFQFSASPDPSLESVLAATQELLAPLDVLLGPGRERTSTGLVAPHPQGGGGGAGRGRKRSGFDS